MSDFDLSARITADASGLVGASAQGEKAIDGIAAAERRATTESAGLESATRNVARAMTDLSGIESRLDIVITELQRNTAGAATGFAGLSAAQTATATATSGLSAAIIGLDGAQNQATNSANAEAIAERNLAQATTEAERSAAAAALAALKLEQAQSRLGRTTGDTTKSVAGQQFAIRNIGQQFGDFGLSVASGQSVARAFGQQAGQLGYALSELQSGPLVGIGKFLVGPWGIALTVGAAFLAPLIGKLFEVGHEAEETQKKMDLAAQAADSYGNAQTLLGKVIDLTTGKLKTQNQVLIETIKLQAQANILKAQEDQAAATKVLRGAGQSSLTERLGADFRDIGSSFGSGFKTTGSGAAQKAQAAALAPLNAAFSDYIRLTEIAGDNQEALTRGFDATIQRIDKLAVNGKVAGRSVIDLKRQLIELATPINARRANQQVIDAIDGKGLADDLRPTVNDPASKKPPKPKSTEARDEFGRDAATKIANIVGQFDEAPAVIDKTNAKVRELDDLIDDLSRKKPPGFEGLIASAEAAKIVVREGLIREVAKAFEQPKTLADKATAAIGQLDAVIADLAKNKPPGFADLIADAGKAKDVIRTGLQKPYEDFVREQREGLEVQQLIAAGRVDEANALKTIQGLQKTMGPLTDAQKEGVLATVEAMRAEARQIDILREKNAKYLEALGGIKGVVQDATQAFVRGDLGQLLKSPKKFLDVFQTFQGRKIFDKIFGDIFRDLEDQANGTTAVKDASKRMADAVDTVAKQTDVTTSALDRLAGAANRAAGGVSGGSTGSSGSGLPEGTTIDENGDIVVTARPKTPGTTAQPKTEKADPFNAAIGKIGTQVASIFTNPTNAAKIGTSIGKFAGKGLEGAATGTFVNGILSPLGKALGFKTSKVGAQIGGTVGAFLPIPFGKEVGAVLGSVVGGLFKTSKFASSTLDLSSGRAVAGTAIGKGSAAREQADALGGSLADGLNSIVAALGAQLGSANVSIGYRPGHKAGAYRVDTTGGGKVTGVEAFKTEAEAVAFAIRDAILDGGITGISEAMRKALTSNADIDRAVQEALGVKALETALGGIEGSLKAQFAAEDAAGRERVRLAKTYGLDLVAVEKLNGEQRVALVDATLKSRIGALADTLKSFQFGDLFEGSVTDKLKALQVEIDKAQKAAEAGTAGAADTLASLLTQKVGLARDSLGTAGAGPQDYAAIRADSISAIERVIKMETDRVNAAAGSTTDTSAAVVAQTAVISEGVDVQVQTLSAVRDLTNAILSGSGFANDYSPNLKGIARNAA